MNDDLDPARGACLGLILGGLVWVLILAVAWFVLPGPW